MLGNLYRNTLGEPWLEHPGGTGPTTGYKGNCSVWPRPAAFRGNRPGCGALPAPLNAGEPLPEHPGGTMAGAPWGNRADNRV